MITTSTDFSSIYSRILHWKKSDDLKQRLMPFLGAALPATHEGGPTSCRKGPTFQISQRRLSGVLISIPCDCMHKGKSCPQRNDTVSRLFAIDYIKSSASANSSLCSGEYFGYVRYTKVGYCEAKLVG